MVQAAYKHMHFVMIDLMANSLNIIMHCRQGNLDGQIVITSCSDPIDGHLSYHSYENSDLH